MHIYSAKEARDNFSEMLDEARTRPVRIRKNGRDVAVVVSPEEYAILEALDDAWWADQASKALKEGVLDVKASRKLTRKILES